MYQTPSINAVDTGNLLKGKIFERTNSHMQIRFLIL